MKNPAHILHGNMRNPRERKTRKRRNMCADHTDNADAIANRHPRNQRNPRERKTCKRRNMRADNADNADAIANRHPRNLRNPRETEMTE